MLSSGHLQDSGEVQIYVLNRGKFIVAIRATKSMFLGDLGLRHGFTTVLLFVSSADKHKPPNDTCV